MTQRLSCTSTAAAAGLLMLTLQQGSCDASLQLLGC